MTRAPWRWARSHPKYVAVRELLKPPTYGGYKLTLKRLLNVYRARYEQLRGRVVLRSYPIKLTIEPTNLCNLRCPACFTGVGEVGRPRSVMSPDLYRKLLDELGDYLFLVEFGSWGEPLLSKHLEAMIEDASRRGIATLISTNLSLPFDAARAERFVTSGLTIFGVSIDGARQETYQQYRVRGNLDTVLANCRLVLAAKKRLQSKTPRVVWGFHVFEHNLGDIELARSMAKELDIDIEYVKGWVVGKEWDRGGTLKFFVDPHPARCDFLWQFAVVNNDGGVAPCCGTFYREDDMGQIALNPAAIGASTFREVWNGPQFQQARKLYLARTGPEAVRRSVCFDCPQTVMWERWQRHVATGGTRECFDPGYTMNDHFNYFFARRPPKNTP
jgi:pyruvate-formate lyase-activating enzyme